MSVSIAINGQVVGDGQNFDDAVSAVHTERYLAVVDGTPIDVVMYDGSSAFEHPAGAELVREADWKGERWAGPPEPDDVRVKRTTVERLDNLVGALRDDLAGFDALTAAQRQASQRRALRAVLLIARIVRDDHTGTVE